MRIVAGAQEGLRTLLSRPAEGVELPASMRDTIIRVFGREMSPDAVVERILSDVRQQGDAAVRHYNLTIDGVPEEASQMPLEVTRDEIQQAYSEVKQELVDALRQAASRIQAFHEKQLMHSLRSFEVDGIGQVVRPLSRVGLYIPGTTAVYPSTVLMTAIPARVAGVAELIMATPVSHDGAVSPLKLIAADVAGVDRIFRAGGVQGIAAMAYGTASIPKVDKICGPGNLFVTLAKKRLFGEVGIDGVFGPSETVVVADGSADPSLVAADLLAGAEHDELATAVLITDSRSLVDHVATIVETCIEGIGRAEVARASLEANGGAVIVESVEEAIELANEFAPEHLCLHVRDAERVARNVRNAGCVFVGARSAESIGDYTAGPSHVMPTGGSATFASPLGVQDFLKLMSVVHLDEKIVEEIGPAAVTIACAEGFAGHAKAVEARLKPRER